VSLPEGLDKLLPAKVIEKAYDDAASPAAKEVGKVAADLVKTARLLLAPFQLAAAYQDRLAGAIERIRTRVPDERQVAPPGEVVGPALRHMQYVDEENPLWKMFEELLTRAIDSETTETVHPSFGHMISQLSRDEAIILYKLRGDRAFTVVDTMDYHEGTDRFFNRKLEHSTLPTQDLQRPSQMDMYYSHLESLSLLTWPIERQEPILEGRQQIGVRRYSTMRLTEFGQLFVSVCVPDGGFDSVYARGTNAEG
jgi:hypothetical protein